MRSLNQHPSKYPRVGEHGEIKQCINTTCTVCNMPASGFVWVEHWCMRSDDTKYSVCASHQEIARADIHEFIKLLTTQ